MIPTGLSVLVTGASPVYWELCLGQAISGTTTYTDNNTTYSGVEYNTAGTLSGAAAIVIDSGWVAASATVKSSTKVDIETKYPITLDAAGVARSLGTLSVVVTGIGGSSACRVAVQWKELR